MGSFVFEVTPMNGAPVRRQAGNIRSATKKAAKEFPAGVVAIRQVKMDELVRLATAGGVLPVFVRRQARGILAAQRAAVRQREEGQERALQPKIRPSWVTGLS